MAAKHSDCYSRSVRCAKLGKCNAGLSVVFLWPSCWPAFLSYCRRESTSVVQPLRHRCTSYVLLRTLTDSALGVPEPSWTTSGRSLSLSRGLGNRNQRGGSSPRRAGSGRRGSGVTRCQAPVSRQSPPGCCLCAARLPGFAPQVGHSGVASGAPSTRGSTSGTSSQDEVQNEDGEAPLGRRPEGLSMP